MEDDGIPGWILEKHPEIFEVGEALRQHSNGQPITIRCRFCGGLLQVTDLKQIGSTWIFCPKGCTREHIKYEPQRK